MFSLVIHCFSLCSFCAAGEPKVQCGWSSYRSAGKEIPAVQHEKGHPGEKQQVQNFWCHTLFLAFPTPALCDLSDNIHYPRLKLSDSHVIDSCTFGVKTGQPFSSSEFTYPHTLTEPGQCLSLWLSFDFPLALPCPLCRVKAAQAFNVTLQEKLQCIMETAMSVEERAAQMEHTLKENEEAVKVSPSCCARPPPLKTHTPSPHGPP